MTATPSLRDQAEALLARLRTTRDDEEPLFDVAHFAHRLLAARQQIAAIWGIEDVQEVRPDLTDTQAGLVLKEVWHKHDAELGISGTPLECGAKILFAHAPATAAAEEE